MDIISELAFFFRAFGRVLEILGAILLIGAPAFAVGLWTGWRVRRRREPKEVTEAREIRRAANAQVNDTSSRGKRAVRPCEAARTIDERAEDLRRDARLSRRLGIEIIRGTLGVELDQRITLVED